jgi:hypothetical protein
VTVRARLGRSRALRYGAATAAVVLLVCMLISGLSLWTLATVGGRVTGATARAHGEVIHSAGRSVEIRWSATGEQRIDTVALAVPAPPVGTRTEVAYDPRDPAAMFIPGSAELAAVDRAASGMAFSGLVGAVVLVTAGWQVISRRRLGGRPGRPTQVRRVRVQSGLLTRSWLELDSPPRWIPVHFDQVLVTLPSPTSVQLHGDPQRRALVAAEVDGTWLHPSGPLRVNEPRGRRIDSPARPDALRSTTIYGWRRQLQADAGLLTVAPIVGLLWVFLDGGGALTWVCATVLTAALALWWAALRGSDPS